MFAEPIDKGGCKLDCAREGMGFANYIYESNSCFCTTDEGEAVRLYGLDAAGATAGAK